MCCRDLYYWTAGPICQNSAMDDMCSAAITPTWIARLPKKPRVILLGSGERVNIREGAERLRPTIDEHVDVVLADFQGEQDLSVPAADFAIVLGGDGSILRAVLQMRELQTPILGVNLGRLGFLAGVGPDELASVLPEVVAGQVRIDEHLMFDCRNTGTQ
jgi:NAD+ kinase